MPITRSQQNHIEFLHIHHQDCVVEISLFGGQITRFTSKQQDKLWLTDAQFISTNRAIRGGIPICWPWFGPKQGASQHGIARTSLWHYDVISDNADKVVVELSLPQPYEGLTLTQRITLTNDLKIELITTNTGSNAYPFSAALHSYLHIADIEDCQISGLGKQYLDKLNHATITDASEVLVCTNNEMDRIYTQSDAETVITSGEIETILQHAGHDSVVVWNPGAQVDAISDMPNAQQRHFVCVESAITGAGTQLQPGEVSSLVQVIKG